MEYLWEYNDIIGIYSANVFNMIKLGSENEAPPL